MRRSCSALLLGLMLLMGVVCPAQARSGHGEDGDELWYAQDRELRDAFAKGHGPVMESHQAFARLGVRWDGPNHLWLESRFSEDGIHWTKWKDMPRVWSEAGTHISHIDTPNKAIRFAQLRARGVGGFPSFLAAELLTRLGPLAHVKREELPPGIGRSSHGLKGPFNPRSAWKASRARCQSSNRSKSRIAIHHTVSPNNDRVSPEARLRGFQSFHQRTRGWCDIGYHLLISQDGRAWEGRPAELLGTHVRGQNTGSLGISFIGTFDSITPSRKMLCTAAKLVDWGVKTFKMRRTRSNIMGHREFPGQSTSCPGNALRKQIDKIVKDSGSGTCSSGTNPPPPTGQTGTLKGAIYLATDKTLKTRISGAKVTVSGGPSTTVGSTGYFEFKLKPGTYTVTASRSGYQTNTRKVTISSGKDTWGSIGLNKAAPSSGRGTLKGVVHLATDKTLKTRISGAKVTVSNGASVTVGANGYFELKLPAGAHTVTAAKSGYKTNSRKITITKDKETWGSIGLSKKTTPPPPPPRDKTLPTIWIRSPRNGANLRSGRVTVSGVVKDNVRVASLTVNSRSVTFSSSGAFSTTLNLSFGRRNIDIIARDSSGNQGSVRLRVNIGRSFFSEVIEGDAGALTDAPDTFTDLGRPPADQGGTPQDQGSTPQDQGGTPQDQGNPPQNQGTKNKPGGVVKLLCEKDSDCAQGQVCDNGTCKPKPPERGCGCQSSTTTPSLVWLLALFALLGFRRRHT